MYGFKQEWRCVMKERPGRMKEYRMNKTAGCLLWTGRILAGAAVMLSVLFSGIGLPGVFGTSFGRIGQAYANAPVPRYEFEITIKNAPEGTWGVDFLVPKDKIPEEDYLELNEEALSEQNLPLDCELAAYEMDGAVSYSAHDKNGSFDSRLGEIDGNLYAYGHRAGYDLVSKLGKETRLILFDEEGNVLAVSDLFKAYGSRPKSFKGEISFDAATGEVVSNGLVGGVNEEGKIDENGGSEGGGRRGHGQAHRDARRGL